MTGDMIVLTPIKSINYEATGKEAIIQNARFLLSTMLHTCYMDREFGWAPPVDDPSEYAKTSMSAQIVEILERTIPEITVEEVTFEEDVMEGKIYPHVKVVIEDDSEI